MKPYQLQWQAKSVVTMEVEMFELGKLAQAFWQSGQSVAIQEEVAQLTQLADIWRQLGEAGIAEGEKCDLTQHQQLGGKDSKIVPVELQLFQSMALA